MKKKIKVSVVIPCYNSEKWINKCLDSIPKRKDIEIIVVNDGSSDNTKGKLITYREFYYKNLIVVSYKDNKGVSYARNKGIEEAKGQYIVFIDSDDYIYGDVFNKIVDNYLDGVNDMVFYDMENNGYFRFFANQDNYKSKYGMYKFIKMDFLGDLRFVEGMQYAEDKDLHLKMMEKYPKCKFSNEIMYHYNYPRKGSLSAIGENR